MCWFAGRFSKAVRPLEKSADVIRKIHGVHSIELGNELQTLAEVLYKADDLDRCWRVAKDALELMTTYNSEADCRVSDLVVLMSQCGAKSMLAGGSIPS